MRQCGHSVDRVSQSNARINTNAATAATDTAAASVGEKIPPLMPPMPPCPHAPISATLPRHYRSSSPVDLSVRTVPEVSFLIGEARGDLSFSTSMAT